MQIRTYPKGQGDKSNEAVTSVKTYRYKGSTKYSSKTDKTWLTKFGNRLKGHFHTHPLDAGSSPSQHDLDLKNNYPNLKISIIHNGHEREIK